MKSITICALVFTLWTFAAFAGSPPPASADPPGYNVDERIAAIAKANTESWGTPDPAAFVRRLQSAVARHDATATALLLRFPLRLIGEKGAVTQLDNTRALEERFDVAFPPEVREALAKAGDGNGWTQDGPLGLAIAGGRLQAALLGKGKAQHFCLMSVRLTSVRLAASQDTDRLPEGKPAAGSAPEASAPPDHEEDPDFNEVSFAYEQGAVFYRALRQAVARHDAAATAGLIEFPLHLNGKKGVVTSLENARALEEHFDEAFPPDLRTDLASLAVDDWWTIRGPTELAIGHGLLWAKLVGDGKEERYLLTTVNLPSSDKTDWHSKGLQYTCQTEKHYIAIDGPGKADQRVRYRAWNKPHFPPDPPDMEATGSWNTGGMGPCEAFVWTFVKGKTTYLLEENICTEGDEPEDAKAELSVSTRGKPERIWWCY